MDNLFYSIHEIFKNQKINTKDIDRINSIPELFNFLKQNRLYSQFKDKNDLILTLKSKSSKYVLKYSKMILYKINKDQDIKTMVKEIYNLYYNDDEKFYESIVQKKFTNSETKQLYDDFFNNLEFLKSIDKYKSFSFFKSLHDEETIVKGNYCMKQLEQKFSHDPNLFIKDNKPNLNVIKNCYNSLNQAIDSFKIIANEFTEICGLLYKREKKMKKKTIITKTLN